MPKFDLKKITAVKGKQEFYQLTIDDAPDYTKAKTDAEKNDCKTGVLDKFKASLERIYDKDYTGILTYMERVSNGQSCPKQKFRELKGRKKSDKVKDYEFKHGDLRVYCFKTDGGKIIAYCGYKNSQTEDILKFRSLKSQYLESIKPKKNDSGTTTSKS